MNKLEGKVAIVTGSSSGLGRAIAKTFAGEGAKVVCSDLRPGARDEGYEGDISASTHEAIKSTGGDAIFVKCDVSNLSEVKALVEAAAKNYGKVDIMVANAGVFMGLGKIHENTEEQYEVTMNVNCKGVWNSDQQAIVQFLKQGKGGKIINISSIGGLVGLPNEAAYCTAKGAVANLTRQVAIDYGRDGITANAICPNFAATAMTRPAYEDNAVKGFVDGLTPLGRWATPEDIAKVAAFLASSDADYITGALIPVDGGYTAQ
jgi:NAD(P)-dependent dehydrogenase (short-subunit alcohol dehydrogenase family)